MRFFWKPEPEPAPSTNTTDTPEALRLAAARLPQGPRQAVEAEVERLEHTDPSAAEYAISLNYIRTLLDLPWETETTDNFDLRQAEAILDASHAGIGHIKELVLEHLAQHTLLSQKKASLLIVDDETVARNNLRYTLAKEGYHIEVAGDGMEAIEKVRQWEFDLIITDLKMERMDGMRLLEEAKKISPNTQVIIVTGYATVDTAVQAMKTGAVHYLSKPIDIQELRETVSSILRASQRSYTPRSPILCFVGPPGVGKTSVGMAIAEALGRKFCRLSLADLRDESELRGHRRTYVGALPGRIIQAIRSVGVKNPVFMLDEMDKIAQDAKGDPASVLLEILDPQQNHQFLDRYVDIPFDLSKVLFIATANTTARLAGPVLDRMEVVPFSGYSETEKLEIAQRFLIPRQLREHGLTRPRPTFTDEAVILLVRAYTNEAGVRGLDREIGRICRKLARAYLEHETMPQQVDAQTITLLLGPPRFVHTISCQEQRVGAATGLVWSETGGELITVEATRMPGTGQLLLTGSLGEVLKESAQIALSYIRSNAQRLRVPADFFATEDIHIHIPAGGISKDGPSAGLTIAVALVSLLACRPVRPEIAMSGEISLTGRVLRVAGIREKLLAARRGGAQLVILPAENAPDVEALAVSGTEYPQVLFTNDIDTALRTALVREETA
ncbi:ATP-dependent protease [Thermodesulfomicrobium sp. WS]|uniref:S16 family serine protease n=1 Tax=Thermodesulfomicrobium sp. WS TaxID=3004129 RepID=UPI002491733A|nr:S16 family serine protease [Thermodesulfomicrobium sp. WS]BDV00194.1 ATP-dependent protease [Thermodesulfomicrobium sp. WS]